jgi:hypothetical protein
MQCCSSTPAAHPRVPAQPSLAVKSKFDQSPTEALRAELSAARVSELRRRVAAAGASVAELDVVDDSDNPKAALVSILLRSGPSWGA